MDTETTTQTPETGSEELAAAEAALAVMPGEDEVGEPEIEGLKGEATKLLGDITATRAVKRALKSEVAELKAQRTSLTAAPPTPAPKSPMEEFVKKNPDELIPGKVHLAESKYQQALKETEQQATAQKQEKEALTNRGKDIISRGEKKYSDFQQMHEDAADVLTDGDWLDVRQAEKDGKLPEDVLYERSIRAILQAGGDRANKLAAHLKSKKVNSESVKKAPKEKDGPETAVPTRKSAHLTRLQDVLG